MNTWTCSVSRDDNKATARTIQFDANDGDNITIILVAATDPKALSLHELGELGGVAGGVCGGVASENSIRWTRGMPVRLRQEFKRCYGAPETLH